MLCRNRMGVNMMRWYAGNTHAYILTISHMPSTTHYTGMAALGCSRRPADIGQTQSRTKVLKRTKRTEPDKQQSETYSTSTYRDRIDDATTTTRGTP